MRSFFVVAFTIGVILVAAANPAVAGGSIRGSSVKILRRYLLDEDNNEVVVPRPRMYGLIVSPLRVVLIDNEDDVVGFIVADDDDDDVDDDVNLAVSLVLLLVGVSIDLVVASVRKN